MNAVASHNVTILEPQRPGSGRGDGVQVMVNKGFAHARPRIFQRHHDHRRARCEKSEDGQLFTLPAEYARAHHLQTHGDLLLAVNGPSVWTMQVSQEAYFGPQFRRCAQESAIHQRFANFRSCETGSATRNRLPAARRARAASHLVCRRALRFTFRCASAGILRTTSWSSST